MASGSAKERQFPDTPQGWAERWQVELDSAKEYVKAWHAKAVKIEKRFRDEREDGLKKTTRWNLFTANIQTQRAVMYGRTPKVQASRQFGDANDDVARVAAEMLERLLNLDIEKSSDSYAEALEYGLSDWLLVGQGQCRIRYDVTFADQPEQPAQLHPVTGQVVAPAVPAQKVKSYECVDTDYIHWTDYLWSPCRNWNEPRWMAFAADMARPALVKRFGAIGELVPMNKGTDKQKDGERPPAPWQRARVWEIWDKETKEVFWYVEGYSKILDRKPDPLGLKGFWPCPKPMSANLTTSTTIPRPDFILSEDLYDEIDRISTRIDKLQRAIKAAGTYDKASPELKRLFNEGCENELLPAANFQRMAEKGGIKGGIDILPIEVFVNALLQLRDYRAELIAQTHQQDGQSDIMRGQGMQSGVTATEQRIKANYGGVRMQAKQDEFARFASDLQSLKAECIGKQYDAATIVKQSNAEKMEDTNLIGQAIELIKSDDAFLRVVVKPEAVSLQDFAAQQQEATEFLGAVGNFFNMAAPVVQAMPGSLPFMLRLLQHGVAQYRGADTAEGILDQAIAAAEQAASQPKPPAPHPPPDPTAMLKLQTQQLKGQQDLAKVDAELKADVVRSQVEVQADAQREADQAYYNTQEREHQAALQRQTNALNPKPAPKPNGFRK